MEKLSENMNYGILIRINREAQSLNLKFLSEISGVSLGHISKIEREIETSTKDMLSYIFEALCIDLNTVILKMETIQDDFWDFYHQIVYFESKDNVTNTLNIFNEKYKDFESVERLLANLIYHLTYDIQLKKCEDYFHLLNIVKDYLDSSYRQLYYDYFGLYFKEKNNINKAIYYLEQAHKIDHDKIVTSMTLYHLGMVYRKNNQILKAYHSMSEAKVLFTSSNNFVRICMTDMVIANIHSTNGEYKEAIYLLKECLKNFNRIKISIHEISKVYLSMIWIYILNDDYQSANDIINQLDTNILSILNNKDSFILYKIILHIHFKEKTSATKLCKSIISCYDEDNLDHNFIMYYFYLIHENKAMRMKYLNLCKSLIDKCSCIIDNRFLFKLWNKECSTDRQAAQFKDTLMNYIFKSFN